MIVVCHDINDMIELSIMHHVLCCTMHGWCHVVKITFFFSPLRCHAMIYDVIIA